MVVQRCSVRLELGMTPVAKKKKNRNCKTAKKLPVMQKVIDFWSQNLPNPFRTHFLSIFAHCCTSENMLNLLSTGLREVSPIFDPVCPGKAKNHCCPAALPAPYTRKTFSAILSIFQHFSSFETSIASFTDGHKRRLCSRGPKA